MTTESVPQTKGKPTTDAPVADAPPPKRPVGRPRIHPPKPPSPQRAVTEAVSHDEQLQKSAKSVAQLVLLEAVNVMKYGTPTAKAQMAGKFVPYVMKAVDSNEEDDFGKLRDDFMKMIAEMRGDEEDEDDPDER